MVAVAASYSVYPTLHTYANQQTWTRKNPGKQHRGQGTVIKAIKIQIANRLFVILAIAKNSYDYPPTYNLL